MIAIAGSTPPAADKTFLELLPAITAQTRRAFARLTSERREEAVQSAVADAYAAFEETAQPDGSHHPDTGRRYRETILEAGGSRPAMESFKAFRGREPSLDALLRHQGMA